MIEETTASFIKEVGIPVVAFIMMYALYVSNQKWQQRQQEKSEERYEKLVATFLASIKEISEQQAAALEHLATKLDEHIRQKNQFMEYIKEMERKKHV